MSWAWSGVALLLIAAAGSAQTRSNSRAEGQLTVTAVVQGSSTVVLGPNGERKLVVANASAEELAALIPELKGPVAGLSLPSGTHPLLPTKELNHRPSQKKRRQTLRRR